MTQGVSPTQKQILSVRDRMSDRKADELSGKWVPTRFRMANVWGWRETITYGIIFIIGAIITAII